MYPTSSLGLLSHLPSDFSRARLRTRVHDVRGELVEGHLRVIGLVCGKLGILERYGVGTHGSGGPGQAKVHGHPVIPWE